MQRSIRTPITILSVTSHRSHPSAATPIVMVVNPSFPSKTVPKFITYAKTHPGQLTMASRGVGTSPHLAGELFKFMTGINMVHVAYRGSGPALTDLLGGHVQVYFAPISASIEYIRAGQLRALAVTSAGRAEALPDIPTAGNFVTGYEASALLMLTVSFSCCDQNLPSRPSSGL